MRIRLTTLSVRLACFFAAFSIDVRAKAEERLGLPLARRPTDVPRGCSPNAEATPCAALTGRRERLVLALAGGGLAIDQDSAAARLDRSKAALMSGEALASAENFIEVSTEFGDVLIEGGEAWLARRDGKLWVDALSGRVALAPRGGARLIEVPPGMRNWLGPVGLQGAAETGFPTSLNFRSHLQRAARVFGGSKEEFFERAAALSESWKQAVAVVASLDEERARARRASIIAEEHDRAERRARLEARNRELRALFRRKTFE